MMKLTYKILIFIMIMINQGNEVYDEEILLRDNDSHKYQIEAQEVESTRIEKTVKATNHNTSVNLTGKKLS